MTVLGHLEQHPGINPPDFTAKVTAVDSEYIQLDCTNFYPMGGGQPADQGTITTDGFSCKIVDIRKKDAVLHHITDAEGELVVGDSVECQIDSVWRNQLSVMHTAQHLISALANEEWGAHTVGNQIGFDRTRIDLQFVNREDFDRDHMQSLVNDSIEKDMAVSMDFRPSNDLLDDPLVRVNMDRMPPNIDVWRTISIGDIDVCPCAGTHVPNTAMIPPVTITRVKSKGAGRLRIEYNIEKSII
jgi:misacylated tRNA(Ala) deacylase